MNGRCEEFERAREGGPGAGGEQARWRGHLAGCADCRAQETADGLLREALAGAPPGLGAGFEGRLRRRLDGRAAGSKVTRRPGGLRPGGLWALGAYGTAAALASAAILARLPWESLPPAPWLAVPLAAVALLSPLVLLDRLGIVRPPG